MREFLEKNWANDMDEAAAKKLCMKASWGTAEVAEENIKVGQLVFDHARAYVNERWSVLGTLVEDKFLHV